MSRKWYSLVIVLAVMIGQMIGIGTQTKATAFAAEEIVPSQESIVEVKPLNPIGIQVTFSEPIPESDVVLDMAKKNFQFSHGLVIRNIPQLKTGSKATYIVPTTVQKPGIVYTLSYKGEAPVSFNANTKKIPLRSVKQVASDTFELVSSLQDGVTDYQNIVQIHAGKRGGLDFIVDDNNAAGGRTYEVIPSLRDATVTITPDKGSPMTANYVLFTQATDGRQAPKFRLPEGESLKPGMKYTVTSEWATIHNPTFKAKKIKPLAIVDVQAVDDTNLTVTFKKDPMDELFVGRRLKLMGADGSVVKAQYKTQSRKGASTTFELLDGAKLKPGVSYRVAQIGQWAKIKPNYTLRYN
ncbi:MAG: hypothetical protein ACE3L7_05295 [Candidatus Pristimantibacillus sp.]